MKLTRSNKQWFLPLVVGSTIAVSLTAIPQAQSQSVPANDGNSETYLIQGKKGENNTCNFSTSLTLHPGEKAVEARQVGFNAANCTATIERTSNLTPESPQDARLGLATKSNTLEAPPTPVNGLVGTAALVRFRAYSRTFVVNRNNVFQHHVKDGVDYISNGFTVSGQCLLFRDGFKWNSALWTLVTGTTTSCLYNPSQTTITASTAARYASPSGFFCPVRTDVYYNRHKTIGRANGTIVDNISFGGSFGCTGSLFPKWQIVRF